MPFEEPLSIPIKELVEMPIEDPLSIPIESLVEMPIEGSCYKENRKALLKFQSKGTY